MPAMKNFAAAEEENDEHLLCLDPEGEEEEEEEDPEEDPEEIFEEDEAVKDDVVRDKDEVEAEEEEEEDSKERSQSDTPEEQPDTEFVEVDLMDLRKDVECPICLGIIRKTRTVMECLHRFCQECIDKSMRLGNNECPACRKHCASRRSLRDDPKFDAFIAALFDDIDAFEAKELAFREEERARNKQIQESIAQISQRQNEALGKKKCLGKEATPLTRSQRSGSGTRRRKNSRNVEQDTSGAHDDDDDDDDNNGVQDSSSDEPYTERRVRKRKKRSASRSTVHPSASNANNNNNAGNDSEEARRDSRPGLMLSPEVLAWGRGGTRSNTRQGNNNQGARNNNQGARINNQGARINNQGANSTTARKARVNKLVEYFGSLKADSVELDIHLKLISLDTNCVLLHPYLFCRPTLLVKQLRKYVASQIQVEAEEIELMVLKEKDKAIEDKTPSSSTGKMQSLEDDEETLAKLKVNCILSSEYLIEVYWQKRTA